MAEDENTEMIEVDPKLFITCRLCLEEMGVYQIVPTVQQQIKYCFDINVEPFDGLPQLLCKKCKVLLDDYSSNKKKFIEKQQCLITKLKVKQVKSKKYENNADFRETSSPCAATASSNRSTNSSSSAKKESTDIAPTVTPSTVKSKKYENNADFRETSSPCAATASSNRSTNSTSSAKKESTDIAPKVTPSTEYELQTQSASANFVDNSADDTEDNIQIPSKRTLKNKKRKYRLMSNSSSGTEKSTVSKKKIKKPSQPLKWHRKYSKHYVCNICSKFFREKRKLKRHFTAHSYIKSKYEFILNKRCRVEINKFDGKPNTTNLYNTVIFDKGKIIQDEGHLLYHVLYTKRSNENIAPKEKAKIHNNEYVESSDDDFVITRKHNRTRQRISRSSNETVLLGDINKTLESFNLDDGTSKFGNNIPENEETECINIDDSSDSNTELDNCANSKQTTETKVDFKTIENIISNCRRKHMKKLELSQNGSNNLSKNMYSETQLKHKILSIGRKNIYKEGHFNCTGLLRYMEHKNLDVLWLPKDLDSFSRENLVRIMTKLKDASDSDNTIDKYGWITLSETERDRSISPLFDPSSSVHETSICNVISPAILSKSHNAATNAEAVNAIQPLSLTNLTSAVLYSDCYNADADSNSKKLLNQSPVANPKQLPKKSYINESKARNASDVVNNKSHFMDLLEEKKNNDNNMMMPVITSTTSLANVNEKAPDIAKATEKSFPRIKVKPVSELMNPPNVKNITNENSNEVWSINNFENRLTPNIEVGNIYLKIVPQIQNDQTIQLAPGDRSILPVTKVTSEVTAANASNTEYIVLDSVELPNTRTDSPFRYFKDLLLMHNIYLLDPNVLITQEYVCLLKIKVQFKQENKDKPVVLCLSLLCLKNAFCICIKDSTNIDIHMTKISANWQWEIMKIFQGDVANKILNNAMRASHVVYSNTKTFLFLLKSIRSK